MDESTTLHNTKVDQCRLNAQRKSERKRQAVLDAIVDLQKQGSPITKTSVAKRASVSYPFLAKHADLLQSIDEAEQADREKRLATASSAQGKDVVISALKRQMENLKQQVKEKDAEIRFKQRQIDQLYGKLASRSELTDSEVRSKLAEALQRLQAYEDKG